jgi:hypothetical protein
MAVNIRAAAAASQNFFMNASTRSSASLMEI